MILGVTGTLGAGKGTVVEFLKKSGFAHYSAREFLIEEIKRRELPVNRDSMRMVGESLRAERGSSYVIDSLYARAEKSGGDAIIESVRTVGEVESLRKLGSKLIAVDADPKVRFERVVRRGSETDKVSFEKFLADEERESTGDDPARMNLKRCIEMADFVILNNGSLDELEREVSTALAKLKP